MQNINKKLVCFLLLYFLVQNHPYQDFLVSKTNTFIHEEKKLTFLFICPLRHSGGGGLRGAKNVSFFGRFPYKYMCTIRFFAVSPKKKICLQ